MLGHQSLETVACQLPWSVPRHRPCQNSGSFQEIPRAAACHGCRQPYAFIMLLNEFIAYDSLRLRSNKRGGSHTKFSCILFCVSLSILFFCGHKSFQNCKCTVHYAPCLWRNTSASSSRFKEIFTLRLFTRLFSRENTGAIAFASSIFTAFWLVWPFFGYEILLRRPELCITQDCSTDSFIWLSNSLCALQISLQHKQNIPIKWCFFCKKAICKVCLSWETAPWISQIPRSLKNLLLKQGSCRKSQKYIFFID